MTACALASLKALESRLGKSPRLDQALKRGKGWLSTRWDPEKNPGVGGAWKLFYLEWVCRALDGEMKLGDRNWKSEVLQQRKTLSARMARFHPASTRTAYPSRRHLALRF